MKLEDLTEATDPRGPFGIVISRIKETNKFEDIYLVDFNTEDNLSHKPGHAQNMFASIIRAAKRHDKWEQIEPMLVKASKTKTILKDWDDGEMVITKYGPFSADELGYLEDDVADL